MDALRETEARVAQLVAQLSATPRVGERAEELVRLLMRLYGAGLDRITGMLPPDTVARLAADDLVGSLLILHDLHPCSTAERIGKALDQARHRLATHAADLELLAVEEGDEGDVVRVLLREERSGCPSSSVAEEVIERAVLTAAPEIAAVRVQRPPREPDLLQILPGPPREDPAAPRREARR
ncbi:NifU family protein [Streptomyces minutiscleroticus]|uniref:Thioredoxin n=1 Tax=Streptomyces minutiscleroticus TaxID=68238 RepID=A0A918KRB9_9ACTN|nr:NifU family protein [Streptomyces minutiscleroticus]GGX71650.1 thioredoxin [Streptomyces minutiscleroticus]